MPLPVKWFSSSMAGAPACSGSAGALIAVLDACLVDGFNLRTLSSLVVAGNIATATSAAHGLILDQVVLITGATPSALNGEWRVAYVDTNTFTFATTGITDGTATGTIAVKAASAGWQKAFSGANKAAYRSMDVAGTRLYLRLDDSSAQIAAAVGYEEMTNVDTGSGLFPTSAQSATGITWRKSDDTSSAGRRWLAFSDSRFVHLFIEWKIGSYVGQFSSYAFGDLISWKEGDAYGCLICGHSVPTPSYPGNANDYVNLTGTVGKYLARSFTQLGSAQMFAQNGMITNMLGYGGLTYPNGPDNSMILNEIISINELTATGHMRGLMPGLLQPIQNLPLTHGDTVPNPTGLAGRTAMMLGLAFNAASARGAIDMTGPWR